MEVIKLIKYVLQGFLLGIAYVAPIGMQNLYVINSAIGLRRTKAYQVALVTTFFDVSLAIACFLGIGLLVDKMPMLSNAILLFGSIAVIYIGVSLVRAKPKLNTVEVSNSLLKVIWTCFVVTWLNPQALIDGSLLLGGFRASLPGNASTFFITGVALASFTWFMSLSTIISIFKHAFKSRTLKLINVICGSIIIVYGLKLGYTLIMNYKH